MLRWLIRLIWTLTVFVVLAVGALFLMPVDRIAKIAADQIQAATGREVTISGDVSLSIWPVAGASLGSVTLANADWSQQGPMLEARDVRVGIDTSALLKGAIRIKHISAESPVVRLETRADGRASWDFGDTATSSSQDSASAGLPEGFSLDRFAVTNATFVYSAEGAAPISYSGTDLSLTLPDQNGPLEFDAVVRPAGTPIDVSGRISAVTRFLSGEVQPIVVTANAGDSHVSLDGRADLSGNVAGRLSVKTDDTDAMMRAFGLDGPGLPAGLGQALTLGTDVTFTNGDRVSLRKVSADLGAGNAVTGDVDIALTDVPQVTASLSAAAFDMSMLTAQDSRPENAGSGWSKDPIDASGLGAFNGEIAVSVGSLDLGIMKLGQTRAVIRNERSRMVVELRDVQAYGGTIAGEFVMNNRSGLSVGGNLTTAGLQVQGLLRDFAEVTKISGLATTNVQFLGVGESLDAIMRSLKGQGSAKLAKGHIEGFNLDQLMRTGKLQGGTTVFNELNASYVIEQGNLVNTDLFATLQDFEASGEGRIGLGAQDLDYLFTPKALRLNKAKGGLAIPVRIEGPWADPSIKPDLKAALDLDLDAEKERLEKKLKEEAAQKERELKDKLKREEQAAKDKITREKQDIEARLKAQEAEAKRKLEAEAQKRLNLQTQQGQSAEDALKQKLEKEAGNALRKLFD